jgi:hypothetical protein
MCGNVIKLWPAVAADAGQDLGSGIDRLQAVAMFRYTFAADILGRVESPLRDF